jgi:hypothetical protein
MKTSDLIYSTNCNPGKNSRRFFGNVVPLALRPYEKRFFVYSGKNCGARGTAVAWEWL